MGIERLIYGVGVNDSLTPVFKDGKIRVEYSRWKDMLKRVYSQKFLRENPSYLGCSVCKEWLLFSNFELWLKSNNFHIGMSIDKDIRIRGNKRYSPDTCCLMPKELNCSLTRGKSDYSETMQGVSLQTGKCQRGFVSRHTTGRKQIVLGVFHTELEAHQRWQKEKIKMLRLSASKFDGLPLSSYLNHAADRVQKDLDKNIETKEL